MASTAPYYTAPGTRPGASGNDRFPNPPTGSLGADGSAEYDGASASMPSQAQQIHPNLENYRPSQTTESSYGPYESIYGGNVPGNNPQLRELLEAVTSAAGHEQSRTPLARRGSKRRAGAMGPEGDNGTGAASRKSHRKGLSSGIAEEGAEFNIASSANDSMAGFVGREHAPSSPTPSVSLLPTTAPAVATSFHESQSATAATPPPPPPPAYTPQAHQHSSTPPNTTTTPTASTPGARPSTIHSSAALFRQPSNLSSKKPTRPPMSRLFSSLHLSAESFLQLQAEAKAYMLDPAHPERRQCVGNRGAADADMTKLKLFNCVRDFLEEEGAGERFFSAEARARDATKAAAEGLVVPPDEEGGGGGGQGDGGGTPAGNEQEEAGRRKPEKERRWMWPEDGNKIVSLVTPLLRRMVTNERQRMYAIETRKGGAAGKKAKDDAAATAAAAAAAAAEVENREAAAQGGAAEDEGHNIQATLVDPAFPPQTTNTDPEQSENTANNNDNSSNQNGMADPTSASLEKMEYSALSISHAVASTPPVELFFVREGAPHVELYPPYYIHSTTNLADISYGALRAHVIVLLGHLINAGELVQTLAVNEKVIAEAAADPVARASKEGIPPFKLLVQAHQLRPLDDEDAWKAAVDEILSSPWLKKQARVVVHVIWNLPEAAQPPRPLVSENRMFLDT
ncbi:hypothetical protein BDY21DRAFT_86427 [Lineolata rhizophorae]|uniref:Uncharacterized protein n=1 Tax=Lineolata rhizophorae TaxID=578093 RepID=A0A6A6PCG0_9PEZI|nr:hypothetical protein BDY21DRAFT_86427 [Lineolata rhizophorae]